MSDATAPFRPTLSFAAWIGLLTLSALLPLLVVTLLVVYELVDARQAQQIASLQRRTVVTADAIGREVDRARTTLKLLTISDVAIRGDFQGLHALAQRVAAADPTLSSVSLVRQDGQYVFSSRRPWGDLPAAAPLLPAEQRVFEAGETVVSGLVPLGRDGRQLIGLAMPLQSEGQPRLSLRIVVDQPALSRALQAQRWPETWTASLVDQRHRIVARSREEARFFGEPVTPTLQAQIERRSTEVFRAETKDGAAILGALASVPGTPWWVAVGLPEANLNDEARSPLQAIGALGLTLVVLGLVGSWWLGRRLTQQVRQMALGAAGPAYAVRELREMDQSRRRDAQALHDARHDALTGLPDRGLFQDHWQALRARLGPGAGGEVALLFIDLDGFKQVNDSLGHDAGDDVLKAVTDLLHRHTRQDDLCARLGGDEFVVAVPAGDGDARRIGESVGQRIVADVAALGQGLGCSIGMVLGRLSDDPAALMERADRAMYQAKREGKNRFVSV